MAGFTNFKLTGPTGTTGGGNTWTPEGGAAQTIPTGTGPSPQTAVLEVNPAIADVKKFDVVIAGSTTYNCTFDKEVADAHMTLDNAGNASLTTSTKDATGSATRQV